MDKKGQVTIFIIVAIVIIAGITSYFVLREKMRVVEPQVPVEVQPVYEFVQDCIRQTGENALVRIGEQGGYFIVPSDIEKTESGTPYLINNEKNYPISPLEVELQLSSFVYEELGFCILSFNNLQGFEINSSRFIAEAQVYDNYVIFNLDYPLLIKKDNYIYELRNFNNIKIPIRVGVVSNVANELINEQIKHPDSLCLSCLDDLNQKNNVSIEIFDYKNDSKIFIIRDYNSQINNEPYTFVFAMKNG